MCKRMAVVRRKNLFPKFWNSPLWKRDYLMQLRFANGLLKVYSIQSILRALSSKQGSNIYSLSANWLDSLIKIAFLEIERENKNKPKEQIVVEEAKTFTTKPFIKEKSTLDKLG